ncbi:EI24 domain-containing protein [Pseudenhygromyxa sp. WMMC2535]|uniref:EI24 domain-containing protein n=1 Tax=Pseudenhygromyxa sp. WMMC2535 TaxID=2712867 RepID=UPI001556AEB8|nr:EI24 domain-containing protein [Pseudenhygromyxa sp. WMMC2535]NVB42709.1 EI24 domain-containing protein [Pseudenhygromyxa sp. WMMC2535]
MDTAQTDDRPFVRGLHAARDGLELAFSRAEVRKAYFRVALGLFALTLVLDGGALWALFHFTVPDVDAGKLLVIGLWTLRVVGTLLVLLLGPLVAILVVNIVFPLFNQDVFMAGLRVADSERAALVEAGPGMPTAASVGGAALRLLTFLLMSLGFFLLGLIPVVGGVVGFVGQTWLTARTVAWELMDPYFDRVDLRYAEQRSFVSTHRRALLGFGLPVAWLLAIPVVGPLAFGLAQAAAGTFVAREVPVHAREGQGGGADTNAGERVPAAPDPQ